MADRGKISDRTVSADESLALHDPYRAGRTPIVEGQDPGRCAVAGGGPAAPAPAAFFALGVLLVSMRRRRALERIS